jgi:integrase
MGRPNANNLPEHLRRRSDGAFVLDFSQTLEDGSRKRVVKSLGKVPKALALKIRDKVMAENAEGQYFKPKVLFSQAAEGFLEYSKSRKRSHKDDRQLVGVLVAHFGNRVLETLTPDAVEAFVNQLRPQGPKGRPLAPATLNRYVACLKAIVNRAMMNNLIDRNPIRGVKLFKENNVRDRVIGREEFLRLQAVCAEHLVPIVTLAYRTGMRKGEILGLRWEQLHLAERVILLNPQDTKTNEAREVPLDDALVELFRRIPRVLGCPNVFTAQGKPVADIKTAFIAACRRAGIENFRFHDLRHCAVTNLRKAGVPQNVIMSISGHKTDSMLRRYDKVDREDRKAALDRVGQFLDTLPSEALKMA